MVGFHAWMLNSRAPLNGTLTTLTQMSDLRELLSVDIDWLAEVDESEFALDDWRNGPGPPIPHIYEWIDQLIRLGNRTAIEVAAAAAQASFPIWRDWVATDPTNAIRPLGGPASPEEQIHAVRVWLRDGDDEAAECACRLADLTIQTHWYHVEYEDQWFDLNPGVWTAESAQFCVESLNAVRCGTNVFGPLVIAVLSAVNAFRTGKTDSWTSALNSVLTAVRTELMA